MNITDKLVEEAGNYVSKLLTDSLPEEIDFHRLEHTEYVVNSCEYIGKNSKFSDDDIRLVKLCAWFHDTGYTVNHMDHEIESVNIATNFLTSINADKEIIDQVKRAILSTRIPQHPEDEISRVLCDADLMHIAEVDYFERTDKMRSEMAKLMHLKVGKYAFLVMSLKFFQNHTFHTAYGKKVLEPKKKINIELIKKEMSNLEEQKKQKMIAKEEKKVKGKGYSRGVESMFRLTARNQISLSSIADNKSNILITVNALMMSITMTVLVTRFEEIPQIIIPTFVFLLVSLVTIVLAILSTRPNISSGKFSKEDIQQNKVNLLFFGNFYNMKLEEYEWAIGELMKNDENLYGTMIKDQYALGKVLAKKYKLLRVAYSVFMYGIIIAVLAFVLAFTNF